MMKNMYIFKQGLKLRFLNTKGSTLFFELTDSETGEVHKLDVSLKQWIPRSMPLGFGPQPNSGVYTFRP